MNIHTLTRRVLPWLILSSLLTSILLLAFETPTTPVQPMGSGGNPPTETDQTHLGRELDSVYGGVVGWDETRELGLGGFGWGDTESARMIVSLDKTELQATNLTEFIAHAGGNIVNTIAVGGDIQAVTVEVPSDLVHAITREFQESKLVKFVGPDFRVNTSFVPNDPQWSGQWGPRRIEADWAWNTTVGSSDILVAIIDTGIDYTHSDLAASYLPLGYDWVNNDANPMDDNGHGTHCAGIVAARLNNSVGIAGIAQVHIMTEKVLDAGGSGFYSWLVQGIYHAVDAGAKILSMSLGGTADSELLHDAVRYAHDHGVLVVAAAGNTGSESPHYPAYYEEIIAVSATDSNDNLASFSTFGDWIDLGAPGVDILSTFPGNSYVSLSGTSMACPHVTGAAALTWSAFPGSSADEIRKVLQRTADDLGEVGFDKYYGNGRVNARRAVAGIPEHDVSITGWKQSYRLDPGQLGVFDVTVSNYGRSNETDVSVQFFVNETLMDTAVIDSLEVDASASESFSWGTATMGVYNVTCYVVPVPGENVTENNVAFANVAVRFSIVIRVPNDYPTIKAAINDAFPGDAVLVSGGRYAEGQIDLLKDDITLVADGHVVLDGWLGGYVLNIMASYVTVDGFDIQNGTTYGINVKGYGNAITRNTVGGTRDGVHLYNSENCVLSRNFVSNGGNGIYIEYSSNNTISQNRLVAASFLGGIALWKSSNNTITENTMTGGILSGAIILGFSENNFIASNNLTGNRCGLSLVGSPNNVLRNNVMTNNWCHFAPWHAPGPVVQSGWLGPDDVDTSNTVDGKPIYYWVNMSDRTVPSDAGCVVLVNCENITAENLDIRNNYNGILLVNSSSILIRRNNIVHNWANYEYTSSGVLTFDDCYNVTITENNIGFNTNGLILWGNNNTVSLNNMANNFDDGMLMGDDNIVTQNNITGNQGVAMYIYGSNCIVTSNNISANLNVAIIAYGSNHTIISNNIIGYAKPFENIYNCSHEGIMLCLGSNCTISSNNIVERSDSGIAAYQSSSNTIFHNNFVKNSKPLYSTGSVNTWDDDYPSGGNYWSNYAGIDAKKGPDQDQPGADGIGDTPQVLDANNTDRYPLITPYIGNSPPQTYTLTITGTIDNNPIEGFYCTPYPRPGTYAFMAGSIVQIDSRLCWGAFCDHWELDGVNIGPVNFCKMLMDKNHTLRVVLSSGLPFAVSIAPPAVQVKVGESVVFKSLSTGGGESFWYQWCLNGTSVWDAISPEWTFTPDEAGTCVVYLNITSQPGNPPLRTVKSNEVSVIVGPQLSVCVLPTTSFKYVKTQIEFTSTVTGMTPPYVYQWYLNGSAAPDGTSSTWTFMPDTPSYYTVDFNVTDSLGSSVMSDEAFVTVASLPTALISPVSSTIFFVQSLQFTSTVENGYAPYLYQWVLNETTVVCATPSFNFTCYAPGNYTVCLNVSDVFGKTVQSNEASITVKPELKVTISPTVAFILAGESVNFTLTPSEGSSPVSYQWYVNGTAVSGATSATWTLEPEASGYYLVHVNMTDGSGPTLKSNIALITAFVPGDTNRDHVVDMRDIGILCSHFMVTESDQGWNPNYDTNHDGVINMRDIGIACSNFMERT